MPLCSQVAELEGQLQQSVVSQQAADARLEGIREAHARTEAALRERLGTMEGLEAEAARKAQAALVRAAEVEERMSSMEERHRGEVRAWEERVGRLAEQLQQVERGVERAGERCRGAQREQRDALAEVQADMRCAASPPSDSPHTQPATPPRGLGTYMPMLCGIEWMCCWQLAHTCHGLRASHAAAGRRGFLWGSG
jgi:hypothetical protein